MSQHTPGPWIASECDGSWMIAPPASDATVIANVGTTARSGTISRARASAANAILMASAPEMLEALHAITEAVTEYEQNVAMSWAMSAIAKAEGRS